MLPRSIKGTSLLLIIGLSLSSCSVSEKRQFAEYAVAELHQRMNEEAYQNIYEETDDEFKKSTTETNFLTLMKTIHQRLGQFKDAKETA